MRKSYSELIYLKRSSHERFKDIIDKWRQGTKIYFFSDNEECIESFKTYYIENMGYLNKFSEFDLSVGKIFNLEMYKCNKTVVEEFFILDGAVKESEENLENITNGTKFNLEQYKIEHLPVTKDILIKAKAGTGKTYSMISRINYLIFKEGYKPSEIKKYIYAITFTNEATFNMKSRLKEYYKSLYILTKDMVYLEIIEEVERMKISTIHKFLKDIIDKIGVRLEFGEKIKIYSGKEEINKIILEEINNYEKEVLGGVLNNLELYEIEGAVKQILEKIEEKNIRIKDGYDLSVGDSRVKLLNKVLIRTQERIFNESKEINKIRLSEHIQFALEGIREVNEKMREYLEIKYLFVDEFQDTDEMQVILLNKLREVINFKMFIVGDINQAIYRFRGADYTAFDGIDKEKMDLEKCTLIKNYRTGDNLLNSINSIFRKTDRYLNYGESLIGTIKDEESKIEEWRGSIVNLVRYLKHNNTNETIAILVRSNSQVKEVKDIFKKSNLYVQTNVSKNIFDHKACKDLYKLVLGMKFNKEPLHLLNLENTNYTTKISNKEFLYNIKDNKEKKLEYIQRLNMIENFEEYLEKIKEEPVMKVLREIKNNAKPWLLEELDGEKREYKSVLDQLFEIIIDKYNGEYLTINKICTFLGLAINTRMQESIRYKEGLEKGTLICSTIHKAKGLEFDNVIIPYIDNEIEGIRNFVEVIIKDKKIGYKWKKGEKIITNRNYSILEKEENMEKIAEEIRNLYVGITRGKKRVYYLGENKDKKLSWRDVIEGRI
ncbi:MAG: UvrD-helicase domain-containing protein [Clostridium sp.]|uniref:UvrD-helicase domain-containing protein n=1 Tax=Clostridium sp. TaxID=1506 RepID=UPI003F3B1486